MESHLPEVMRDIDRQIKGLVKQAGMNMESQIKRRAGGRTYPKSFHLVSWQNDMGCYARVGTDDFRAFWREFGTRAHKEWAYGVGMNAGVGHPVASVEHPGTKAHPAVRPGGMAAAKDFIRDLEALGLQNAGGAVETIEHQSKKMPARNKPGAKSRIQGKRLTRSEKKAGKEGRVTPTGKFR